MRVQSRSVARQLACGALSLGFMLSAPMVVGGAWAQTTIVDPNAPKGNLSAHDAALDAARRGDYVAALELSKKAAADGKPLEADQVDFISGKAAKQQAAADDAAKLKAKQQEAAAAADEIQTRQQKEYAQRGKKEQKANAQCSSEPRHIGTFTSAAGAAASTGNQSGFGAKITGADDPKCPG